MHMPMWQLQVCETPVWIYPSRRYVSKKIDSIFKELSNIFSIADDILFIGHDDGTDHDCTICRILQICRKENKDKWQFRCFSMPFFSKIISRHSVRPGPYKLCSLTEMPLPKTKNKLQSFLIIFSYLRRFSPWTAKICEPLQRLTSANT